MVKHLPANARDTVYVDLVLVLGRSPGGENGNPSQDLAWEKAHQDRGALVGLQSMALQSDMAE